MSNAWEMIYLDVDRARSLALELGATPAQDAGSRSDRAALLRDLLQTLAGKVTEVSAAYDFAAWKPDAFRDGQIVRISTASGGMLRLLDFPWLSSVMETMPRMLKVSQRAELSALKQKREAHQITQQEIDAKTREHQAQLKDLDTWKMDELTDVVRELFGSSVRLKLVPGGAKRGEMFVASCPPEHFLEPPALLSQRYGVDIDAPIFALGVVNTNVGIAPSAPAPLMPTGNGVEDMFEQLALAVNRIHRVASSPDFPAVSMTPLALWREIGA